MSVVAVLRPGRAIARATRRSLQNSIAQLFHRSPVATVLAFSAIVLFGLAIIGFQLYAIAELLTVDTLAQLNPAQLEDVGRASLAGMAATAWGVSIIIDVVGLQPAGVRVVAVSKGVGRWNRAFGELLWQYILAFTVAGVVVGPTTIVSLARIHSPDGQALARAVLVALFFTALTTLVATLTPLTIPSLLSATFRRSSASIGVKAAGAAVSGVILIAGVGLVMTHRTVGLYFICPPLVLSAGVPGNIAELAGVAIGCLVWCGLCAMIISSVASTTRVSDAGVALPLSWLRLRSRAMTIELRQVLRDPLYLSGTSVSLASAASIAVMSHRSGLSSPDASLLLMGLCGMSALIAGLSPFRLGETAWFYATRPGGFSFWASRNQFGALAAGMATVVVVRLATTLPFDLDRELVVLTMSLAGCTVSVLFGTLLVTNGSAEPRLALLGSGILSTATLAVLFVVSTQVDLLSSAMLAAAYWMLVSALACMGVMWAMMAKDSAFTRGAQ